VAVRKKEIEYKLILAERQNTFYEKVNQSFIRETAYEGVSQQMKPSIARHIVVEEINSMKIRVDV